MHPREDPVSVRSAVKDGYLRGPSQSGFDPEKWTQLLESISEPTADDRRLVDAALFLGRQLQALRNILPKFPPPGATSEAKLRHAVGLANREALVIETFAKTQVRKLAKEPTPLANLLEVSIPLLDGLTTALPAEVIESAVDGLRFELASIRANKDTRSIVPQTEALRHVVSRNNLAVMYHILEEQWLDCLHHGWGPVSSDGAVLLAPLADEESAKAAAVGNYRYTCLSVELLQKSDEFRRSTGLYSVHPSIVRDQASRLGYRIVNPVPEVSRRIDDATLHAYEPDLSPLFNLPIDVQSGLTTNEMLSVWCSLAPLAFDLSGRMPRDGSLTNIRQLEEFAPIQDVRKLARAVREATRFSRAKCEAALSLLTWRDHRDSLWSRPIVPLAPAQPPERALIVLPALSHPNLQRSVEYWLGQESSPTLSARGEIFERDLRRLLGESIASNKLFGSAGCLANAAIPTDPETGDIDVLAWIGDTVLVGEAKSLLRPVSSHEWFKHRDYLDQAAAQAARKSAWVRNNPQWFAHVAGRPVVSDLSVCPVVIVNAATSALRAINGIPIVDRYIVGQYFSGGTALPTPGRVEEIRFYSSEAEAATELASYLSNPPHLSHYWQAVRMAIRWQVDLEDNGKWIGWVFPRVELREPDRSRGVHSGECP